MLTTVLHTVFVSYQFKQCKISLDGPDLILLQITWTRLDGPDLILLLGYLKDSNAAARSVDTGIR